MKLKKNKSNKIKKNNEVEKKELELKGNERGWRKQSGKIHFLKIYQFLYKRVMCDGVMLLMKKSKKEK